MVEEEGNEETVWSVPKTSGLSPTAWAIVGSNPFVT